MGMPHSTQILTLAERLRFHHNSFFSIDISYLRDTRNVAFPQTGQFPIRNATPINGSGLGFVP